MLASLVLTALALLALQVVLVALIGVLRPHGNVYARIIAVCVLTAPLAFVSDRVLLGEAMSGDGRGFLVLIHLALGGFLFHFMTLPDRSVTLRVLVELLQAPGQALSARALKQQYSVRKMIASRLEQLTAARFIAISADERIGLTARGLWFGRFVTAGRKLFGITSAN